MSTRAEKEIEEAMAGIFHISAKMLEHATIEAMIALAWRVEKAMHDIIETSLVTHEIAESWVEEIDDISEIISSGGMNAGTDEIRRRIESILETSPWRSEERAMFGTKTVH
jgi:hypothetical protein